MAWWDNLFLNEGSSRVELHSILEAEYIPAGFATLVCLVGGCQALNADVF